MSGLLITDGFVNHSLSLSQAIFPLSQATLTDADLQEDNRLLASFANVRMPYWDSAATFIVHQLLHLRKSIKMLGPPCRTSTLPFENGNGQLLKFVTAALQIAERLVKKSWVEAASKIVKTSVIFYD